MMTNADESAILAARHRLHTAGYPADDLSDDDVWAGRRVWWGQEAEWVEVAQKHPKVAEAIILWANSRPLPNELKMTIGMQFEPGVLVTLRLRQGDRQHRCERLLTASQWVRTSMTLNGWVMSELDRALAELLRLLPEPDRTSYIARFAGPVRLYRPADAIPRIDS